MQGTTFLKYKILNVNSTIAKVIKSKIGYSNKIVENVNRLNE